jgi:hypothetical protein
MRPKGTKNIIAFEKRTTVETTSSEEIRHLANLKGSPLQEFSGLLKHQENFLNWVDDRHDIIVELGEEIRLLKRRPKGKGPPAAKEGTFEKYRWYSKQLILLEAINAFEAFYKKTFVQLGIVLHDYVQPEVFKDIKIDPTLVWSTAGQISAPALIFEQSLFHDLEAIDKSTQMLVGYRRYNQNSPDAHLADRVRALRAIFQIRHTLSHNNGLVTDGDAAKFKRLKFNIAAGEVIDPSNNYLGLAVFRELNSEADEFTKWLASATSNFLISCITKRSLSIPAAKRKDLESLLGAHASWAKVTWS